MLAFVDETARTWFEKVLSIACVVVMKRKKKSSKRLREEEDYHK